MSDVKCAQRGCSFVQGSTFAAIKSDDVARIKVPLPPLAEQRRIVEILDHADRLRRLRAEADVKATRVPHALFIKCSAIRQRIQWVGRSSVLIAFVSHVSVRCWIKSNKRVEFPFLS